MYGSRKERRAVVERVWEWRVTERGVQEIKALESILILCGGKKESSEVAEGSAVSGVRKGSRLLC